MAKGQRSNREVRKPKKTAAQRSVEQPATDTAALFKQQKQVPKGKR